VDDNRKLIADLDLHLVQRVADRAGDGDGEWGIEWERGRQKKSERGGESGRETEGEGGKDIWTTSTAAWSGGAL
jgi:hypothetical protein